MSGSEWLARLTGSGGPGGVDPEWFAGLARADLQSLHIDERGRSLTAAFVAVASPDDAAADAVHDAVEFFVVFSEVADLAIRGWSHEAAHSYSLEAGQGGRRSVTIEGGGSVVTFTCEDSAIEQVRTFRSGPL
jgi:hypothetical protein